MLTVKPAATAMAAAAASVESADVCSGSAYRTCRLALTNPGVAVSNRCCQLVELEYCYCDIIQRISDARDKIWCLSDVSCTQSSLGASDDS
jgi:hypothetical protein